MVIIVFGLPGSGKSYFASRLAERVQADHISSDSLRLEMFPHRTYSDSEKQAVYDRMLDITRQHIANHTDVVLDATFYKNSIRKAFQQIGPVAFIEMTADEEVIEKRLKRPRPQSEADINVYRKLKRAWEPCTAAHLTLRSTDDNIDDLLNESLKYLSAIK